MKKSSFLKSASPYLFFAVVCIVLMIVVDGTFPDGTISGTNMALVYIISALVAAVAVTIAVLALRKKLTDQNLILLLLLAGFLIRLAYVIYNQYYDRQHDVQKVNNKDGHAGYILHLVYNNFKLPETNPAEVYQFYHPPFYYYVSAAIVRFLLGHGFSLERAFESLQMLPLFLSCCIMVITLRIFKELGLRGTALRVASALVLLHPTLFFMSGFLNNDIMSIAFVFAAILFTIQWYKQPTLTRIIPIALCVGLGMMSKLSGALVAPAVAFVFLIKLWQTRKQKPLKMVGQFAGFGAVCAPLGLWWGVRNLIMFNIPITFVPPANDSTQYIGDFSVVQRLFDFQTSYPFISIPYFNDYILRGETLEHGIAAALIKTSLFGEWTLGTYSMPITTLSFVLFWLTTGIIAVSLYMMAHVLIKSIKSKSKDIIVKIMLAVLFLTLIVSQIKFCFDAPYVCTQNFRYIVPTLLTSCAFIGYWFMDNEQPKKLGRILRTSMICATVLFCVLSTAIYIMLYISAAVA